MCPSLLTCPSLLQDPGIQDWGNEEEDDGDPPRLWSPTGNYPGTAFTRSIGDSGMYWLVHCSNHNVVAVDMVTRCHCGQTLPSCR